jgi:3-oxoacyl-[acyl-carrier-protein] synthase II
MLAIETGAIGHNVCIVSACATGTHSVAEGAEAIRRGDCIAVISGSTEAPLLETAHAGFTNMRGMGMPRPGEGLESVSRPFDKTRDGFVLGEGAGGLFLEDLELAKARGAKIYAELVGFGASQDTYSVTQPEPTGHSYGKAISKALADANLPPNAVDLLVPTGLGIQTHDRAELSGLHTVFGGGLERVALSPIKAQTGNMAAGSGVDAAAAVLALHHDKIPAALNTRKVIDGKKLNVKPEPRDAKVNVSVSSVYSLGGQNAALVFRKV